MQNTHGLPYSFRDLIALVCILLFLLLVVSPALASNGDHGLVPLAKTLTTKTPDSKEWKDAAEKVRNLSIDEQGQVGTLIKNEMIDNTDRAVDFLLTLNNLGATAGKDPFGKALGSVLAIAFDNLFKILKGPPTTNGGWFGLEAALGPIIIRNEDRQKIIGDLADKVYKARWAAREAQQKKEQQERNDQKKSNGDSVSFDATTGTLSFSNDKFVASGPSDVDSVIGATLIFPNFKYTGITPQGDYVFTAIGDGMFAIQRDADVFAEGVIPFLTYGDGTFLAIPTDLVLSGADTASIFYGGLPSLSSDWISAVLNTMTNDLFGNAFIIQFSPMGDFLADTANWTISSTEAVVNGAGPAHYGVPEPPLLGLITIGLFALWFSRRRYCYPESSSR